MKFICHYMKKTSIWLCLLLTITITSTAQAAGNNQQQVDLNIASDMIEFSLSGNPSGIGINNVSRVSRGTSGISRIVVTGPNGIYSESDSSTVIFDTLVVDGQYRYEISSHFTSNDEIMTSDGRDGREDNATSSPQRSQVVASGHFRIVNGTVPDRHAAE